jgi:signal recognition particle subunit SRP19
VVARDAGKVVLWPHYFDRNLSRAQGRRVPMELAVEEPKAGQIAQAARTLGLKVELDDTARPPRAWNASRGRVLVAQPAEKKEALLRQVAQRL